MTALRKHPSMKSIAHASRTTRGSLVLGVVGAGAMLAAVLAIAEPARATADHQAAAATQADRVKTDIVLRVADLPAADRARLYERNDAIEAALATGLPTWRSFDPNETLSETLAELAKYGVDVGDGALVNFDHIETTMPASRRAEVQALPYVYLVRNPVGMTESCVAGQPCQSAGSAQIGSDVANAAGITGTGVKVAIIDDGFRNLNNTILAGELPAIPDANTFLVNNNVGLEPSSPRRRAGTTRSRSSTSTASTAPPPPRSSTRSLRAQRSISTASRARPTARSRSVRSRRRSSTPPRPPVRT